MNGHTSRTAAGYSLVELLAAMAIGAVLVAGLDGVLSSALGARAATQARAERLRNLGEAMATIESAVHAGRLILPLGDNPATTYDENIREQTDPLTMFSGGTLAQTAALAVSLDPGVDRDRDGVPDADNDGDGRIDEDWPADASGDGKAGVANIDDDGLGLFDVPLLHSQDDDESGTSLAPENDEDPLDGIDNDGDGSIDEDTPADMNGDGAPGVAGIDDDGDGTIDEGAAADDDEDGTSDEDWLDIVAFYLSADTLYMRIPVPWDTDGSGTVTGADAETRVLVSGITRFRVERIASADARYDTVRVTLVAGDAAENDHIELDTVVRANLP